jgi:hypothetical protein
MRRVGQIAGGSVLSYRTYLERLQGPGTFDKVLGRMAPEDAAPLRGIIMPVAWYPTVCFVHALHAGEAMLRDAEFYENYGAFAAEYEISAFQRFALKFTSPTYLLDRAGRMWHRFHDTGDWEVEGDRHRMKGTLRNFAIVDARYCRVVAAWIKRAGQMTGARGEVAHPECRARGAEACVFTGWWS